MFRTIRTHIVKKFIVISLHDSRRLLHKILTTNGFFKALIFTLIFMFTMQSHAGFSALPPELKSIIVTSLIDSYSCHGVVPCVEEIQSISCVDRAMRAFITADQTTAMIIRDLIRKFGMDKVEAAVFLAMPRVVVLLKNIILKDARERKYAEELLLRYAGQEERPESIIKIKILLKAGVNVNTYQERKLGVLNGAVERITPLAIAQKKGNKQIEKVLLRHPQIDLGFKAVSFRS